MTAPNAAGIVERAASCDVPDEPPTPVTELAQHRHVQARHTSQGLVVGDEGMVPPQLQAAGRPQRVGILQPVPGADGDDEVDHCGVKLHRDQVGYGKVGVIVGHDLGCRTSISKPPSFSGC